MKRIPKKTLKMISEKTLKMIDSSAKNIKSSVSINDDLKKLRMGIK